MGSSSDPPGGVTKRIVITSWGSYGDVYPYVGLGKVLRGRGHHVTLAVPGYYRGLVEREGLVCHAVGPEIDPADRATIARLMDPVNGTEAIIRDLLMPTVRRSYESIEPIARDADLLITHPVTFAGPLLADTIGLPWISTTLAPISFFSVTDMPVLSRTPSWLPVVYRPGRWSGRLIAALARRVTRGWTQPVEDLRKELGLGTRGNPIFEGQFSPTRTLALFSRVLAAPQPDWPPHTTVTGFVFYNGPEPLSPELEAFLAAGPAPVVFTLGTSAVGAAGSFYEESAAAIVRLGRRAVLLTGGFPENIPQKVSSPHIVTVDRAPHQLLFPRAAAVVHQGGVGTTGQALRAGCPVLVVPHSHDQPDNASRLSRLGVARTLYPSRYRAARVAEELHRLLTRTHYREQSQRTAAVVATERGAEGAADAIEAVIGR